MPRSGRAIPPACRTARARHRFGARPSRDLAHRTFLPSRPARLSASGCPGLLRSSRFGGRRHPPPGPRSGHRTGQAARRPLAPPHGKRPPPSAGPALQGLLLVVRAGGASARPHRIHGPQRPLAAGPAPHVWLVVRAGSVSVRPRRSTARGPRRPGSPGRRHRPFLRPGSPGALPRHGAGVGVVSLGPGVFLPIFRAGGAGAGRVPLGPRATPPPTRSSGCQWRPSVGGRRPLVVRPPIPPTARTRRRDAGQGRRALRRRVCGQRFGFLASVAVVVVSPWLGWLIESGDG